MIIEKITFLTVFVVYIYFIIYLFRKTNIIIGALVLFVTAILIGIMTDIILPYFSICNKYTKLCDVIIGGTAEELIRASIIIIFIYKFRVSTLQSIISTALLYTVMENLYGYYPIYISYFNDTHHSAVKILNSGFFNMFFSSLQLFTKFLMHITYLFISVNSIIRNKYHLFLIISFVHGLYNGIGYLFNIYFPVDQYAENSFILVCVKIILLYFVFYKIFNEEGFGINRMLRTLKRA